MWTCSAEIEAALWAATEDVVGDAPLAPARLRSAIVERSRRYTSDRDQLAMARDTAADLAARALFFTVADVPKIMIPAAELAGRGLLPRRARVLDLGAGCGAMLWGLHAAGVTASEAIAVDRDADALRIAAGVARRLDVPVSTRTSDVAGFGPRGSYDLIVMGSVLNELGNPTAVVRAALDHLDESGSLIIIEPALRDTSRALHELRDRLLDDDAASVFAPCVRRRTPCPALSDERDWCHEDRSTELPPHARRLGDETGLRRYGLKFSYLVLRRDGAAQVDDVSSVARVVSRVRKLKGRWEGFLCGEGGRERARLLKRTLSDQNRDFARLDRGDLVRVTMEGAVVRTADHLPTAGDRTSEGDGT